jgi:hypothetical protein
LAISLGLRFPLGSTSLASKVTGIVARVTRNAGMPLLTMSARRITRNRAAKPMAISP